MSADTITQAIENAERKKQLRLAYAKVFTSESGRLVLEDMKKRFGWDGDVERPSCRPGMAPTDAFLVDGMKEPVRHILAMLQTVDEQPKPTNAVTQ